jgi:transposase-like protein
MTYLTHLSRRSRLTRVSKQLPTTLLEAVTYFSDLDRATEFVSELRWPDGPVCPRCESSEHSYISTRRVWKCKGCKKQYSVKLGTIFEDSPLGLDKWLPAVWLIANSKNGISSHELGRALGVTQKSTWFMLHRIRLAMQTGSFEKFDGEVEVDESWIGGKAKNLPLSKRKQFKKWDQNKTVVGGVAQRGGKVRAVILPNVKTPTLEAHVCDHVAEGATVYTDKARAYKRLPDLGFSHGVVDHMERYVEGRVHTNCIENFWSLVKRGLNGTYISVQPKHLQRYLDERVFTFNERELDDYGRFEVVLRAVAGRRLTWATLTGK